MPKISEIDKKYIIDNYKTMNGNELSDYLGYSRLTIYRFLKKQGIYYNHRRPSPEEEIIIKSHYNDIDWLVKNTKYSKRSIIRWLKHYNLYDFKIPSGNIEFLLNGNLESYYWLGFIAADGCLNPKGELILSQSFKDKDRIELFSNKSISKIKTRSKLGGFAIKESIMYQINIHQKIIVDKLRQMFGLSNIQKTKSGIKLDFINTSEQAMSFLCGFIDGDGNVRNDNVKIQCYKTWYDVFGNLRSRLPKQFLDSRIWLQYKKPQKSYYATWIIRSKNLRYLKKFAIENNIPISPRKWSVVDENKEVKGRWTNYQTL